MNQPAWDTNRLAGASSPYLRQHAGNPVHWQQWNDDTLAHARETDTPILLSIGYSACHWCHVMAQECFEIPAIAAVMNANFVNIKLDREERPDIDHVYQLAHQALSGRGGGWPLTAFLDPQDLAPFYVGTYFPPKPGRGLPGFPEVLQRARDYFDAHRSELRAQAGRLHDWMAQVESATGGDLPEATGIQTAALQRISADYDTTWGGHRGAPKFPHAAELGWLLDLPDSADARAMARHTLTVMARRGLQDHLGGGFFRYTVDAAWTIPHFEKMLYDNAQLLPLYARLAAERDAEAESRGIALSAAQGIADWLAREMTASNGAFCSSLDADSEHQEGKYYLWTREEMRALAGDDHALAEAAFGLDAPPNFENRAWHLMRDTPLSALAGRLHAAPETLAPRLDALRQRLLDARQQRTVPARDDKLLTAWNAVMIAGLARAGRLLDDSRMAAMAERALEALHASAWIDGTLYANIAPPAARIAGFLDDHALLLDALLELLQVRFAHRDLALAIALADALLEKFEDAAAGGFWFAAEDHATPLGRGRNLTDDALPNGYAMATLSLLRLGDLLGDARYLAAAERALKAASGALAQYPEACPSLMRALVEYARPRLNVVIRCQDAERSTWQAALDQALASNLPTSSARAADAFIITDSGPLPGVLSQRRARSATGTAYVCAGMVCRAPVTSPAELADALHAALQT